MPPRFKRPIPVQITHAQYRGSRLETVIFPIDWLLQPHPPREVVRPQYRG
ncbi:hypothetical protein BD779DRAFT_1547071 [Infundibulicybe gibba]|nr:hypothetical protein BD779DRAFT_1547071 [Infundibulicybe gibba]